MDASGKIGGVEQNVGGVENFIRKVREILGGLPPRVYAHA